jgi:hypothetical protein
MSAALIALTLFILIAAWTSYFGAPDEFKKNGAAWVAIFANLLFVIFSWFERRNQTRIEQKERSIERETDLQEKDALREEARLLRMDSIRESQRLVEERTQRELAQSIFYQRLAPIQIRAAEIRNFRDRVSRMANNGAGQNNKAADEALRLNENEIRPCFNGLRSLLQDAGRDDSPIKVVQWEHETERFILEIEKSFKDLPGLNVFKIWQELETIGFALRDLYNALCNLVEDAHKSLLPNTEDNFAKAC